MKAFICDHCDTVIREDVDVVSICFCGEHNEFAHLCHDCYIEFQAWLYMREKDEHE